MDALPGRLQRIINFSISNPFGLPDPWRAVLRTFCSLLVAILILAHPALADRWVSTEGSDAAAGSQLAPYRTITKALSVAAAGETIRVAAGTYDAAGGERFPLVVNRSIFLLGEAGAAMTILDAAHTARVMIIPSEGSGARVEGFTIRNGYHLATSTSDGGAGILIRQASNVVLARNIIESNGLQGRAGTSTTHAVDVCGGGVHVTESTFSIENNIFLSNGAGGGHGGGYQYGGEAFGGGICAGAPVGVSPSAVAILHNTFYGNRVNAGLALYPLGSGYAVGGAIFAQVGTTIRNNVFSDNAADGGFSSGNASSGALGGGAASGWNLFYQNYPDHGTVDANDLVDVNPAFVNAGVDFHVTFGSPVTGAGVFVGVAEDFDRFQRGLPPSIGAFEPPPSPDGGPGPTGVEAVAVASTQIAVTWNPVVGATGYRIERREAGSAFVPVGTATWTSFDDTSVVADRAYLYRVVATTNTGSSQPSSVDLASTFVFTAPTLFPGVTVIRAVHLTELRAAVNEVRALAGAGPASWTDPHPGGVVIKAIHWSELRERLNEARLALGLPTAPFPTAIFTGALVRASSVEEYRAGLR
jgi:hypothetical protein